MNNEHQTLEISNKDDRETVAVILFRNGYDVKEKRRKNGSKTIVHVEYWKEEDKCQTE